jgi:hypothetical protein
MFGDKSSISNPYYPMSHDDLKYQDSGIIGNIAASNAIWVETYGTRRKKGNRKKSDSLRHVAPIDYNEGSNEEEEEEVFGSDEEGFDYQFHSDIPTSSHKKDKKATPKRLSSSDPSPSSFLKPAAKPKLKSEPAAKRKKKREILELLHSDSDDSLLLGKKKPKQMDDMDLIKQQLKATQDQYAQMSNLILNLTTQLASKPAAKPEQDTLSKKEITPKKDDTEKIDNSMKKDTLRDTDDEEADV